MKTILFAAGAVAIAFTASQALATPAGPKQPIPYSQLNAYLKASPKLRATKDWSATAPTGASVNTNATAAVSPSLPGDTAIAPTPSARDEAKTPILNTPPSLQVNPPNPAAPPSPDAPPK
jgi:hypothetical protein